MTRTEKLIKRFLSRPKDFTWEELVSLLSGFGFEEVGTGKTGGSRRRFLNDVGVIIKAEALNQVSEGNTSALLKWCRTLANALYEILLRRGSSPNTSFPG